MVKVIAFNTLYISICTETDIIWIHKYSSNKVCWWIYVGLCIPI